MDRLNQNTYERGSVIDYYRGLVELFPAERVIFEDPSITIDGANILDLGFGGGRTTRHLLPRAAQYTGLDYVEAYVATAREEYATGTFLVGDARDLGRFSDQSFDLVLFSFNGIDALSHDDRIKTLKEIFRVLTKDGVLVFSSHNRDFKYFRQPYWLAEKRLNLKLIKNIAAHLFFLPRRLRLRRYEVFEDQYAVINDADHRYSLLMHYITIDAQKAQLADIGFMRAEAYSERGKEVGKDSESFWVYYVARKGV